MKPLFPFPEDQDHNAAPVNPLPVSVILLALAIFGVELVMTAAGAGFIGGPSATGWRLAAIERFGFYEPLMNWMMENGIVRWEYMLRLVTYPFIHSTFTHALFVLVFLLAMGKLVGEVLADWAVLVIFFGATILGAVVYGLAWDTRVMLFGGYPGAYGLVGGFTFVLWAGLAGRATGLQAFTLIAFLMGIQLVFGLLFGGGYTWVADLSGFVAGFGLAFLVSPGGWQAVVRRVRRS
jgi:membrane associated rhomboid family serine protease